MPGVVRQPDIDSMGHPNITSSFDTFTNNRMTTRMMDMRPCPPMGGLDIGVRNVLVNNRPIQVCGDPVTSGHIQVQCSENVFAGP